MCREKLVYVELFRPFSRSNPEPTRLYTTSHAVTNDVRNASVIRLSDIKMTCHLAPRYSLLNPDLRINSSIDLLSTSRQFYLNKYISHYAFAIFEHWSKQQHAGESRRFLQAQILAKYVHANLLSCNADRTSTRGSRRGRLIQLSWLYCGSTTSEHDY